MDNQSSNDIVRVKTLMVGDEFELIVPRELAEMLELNGKKPLEAEPQAQPQGEPQASEPVVPGATPPKTKSLADIAAGHGVLLVEQAIPAEKCHEIVAHARLQNRHRSGLVNYDNNEDKHLDSFVDDKVRDTYNISVDAIKDTILKNMFFDLITQHVEPFYRMQLEWWEQPQLLYYNRGGKYEPHVDAEYWVTNPDGTSGWKRISDRDLSILLYLNDDFEGGELNFPDYNFMIKPKPGMLVAFPSGKEFRHGANPTLSGERFVLVSWASAEGIAKVQPQPPRYPVVWMKEMRSSAA